MSSTNLTEDDLDAYFGSRNKITREGEGMNILQAAEASKSGKKVRRPCWLNKHYWLTQRDAVEVSCDDILATDWEIEERKIEITESEFVDAWNGVCAGYDDLLHHIKKRLFDK
jgi:hypothetical protein